MGSEDTFIFSVLLQTKILHGGGGCSRMLDCIISITFRNEVQDIVIKEKEERILKACACCQERTLHETSLGLVH